MSFNIIRGLILAAIFAAFTFSLCTMTGIIKMHYHVKLYSGGQVMDEFDTRYLSHNKDGSITVADPKSGTFRTLKGTFEVDTIFE